MSQERDYGDEQVEPPESIGPMHGPHVARGHRGGGRGLDHWIDETANPCQHPVCAAEREHALAYQRAFIEPMIAELAAYFD